MLLAFLPLMPACGEVLITTNGEVFRFNLSTGQVALISYYYGEDPQIIANGETNDLDLSTIMSRDSYPQPGAALAGPLELVKTNSGSSIISYQILTGSAISSEIVTSQSTNSINVPIGKTIKFLPPLPAWENNVSIQKEGKVITDIVILGGEEFAGPLTISFKSQGIGHTAVYSYYFTENAVVLPELKLLQGPTGNFQVGVDKSTDLTNWFPVIIHNTADEQKAFYRLRLSK